jgi:hypothetical protein
VHIQDLLAATHVWQGHVHLAVETTGAQQRWVQDVRTVGRGHHDHAGVGVEAVHLDQHLVEGLLALVVATTQASATVTTDRIDFVDEDDARGILLGLLEHVTHTRCAHADEHFHEVRTRDGEERHFGFARNGLGQQRLTRTRRADQQHTAGNAAAELLELLRVAQEVDQLLHFFLGLVAPGNVSESDGVVALVEHAGATLAEAERPALAAAALHLAHEIHPHADQQEHRAPGHQQAHDQRRLFTGLHVKLDTAGQQIAHQATVQVGGRAAQTLVVGGDRNDLSGTAPVLLQHHALDAFGTNFLQEVRIGDLTAGRADAVELFEHGEQHQCHHQPDCNLREPLIVHRGSLFQFNLNRLMLDASPHPFRAPS